MRYDPLVLAYQAVAMQRIADYVRSGHTFWTSGEVPQQKAAALVRKFDRLYGIGRTRNQRATDKSHGVAGATMILYCPQTAAGLPHTDSIKWVLLVSTGDSVAHTVEKLQDARVREARLRWGDYELLQIARPGQAKPAWSWRISAAAYEDWRHRIIETVRHKNTFQVECLQLKLLRLPGFSGVRVQAKKLAALLAGESARTNRTASVLLKPRVPRYAQRLPNKGRRLSAFSRMLGSSSKAPVLGQATSDGRMKRVSP